MRRATAPLLAAWLLATFGAVGVAWFGVHPVADMGSAERPPVPRPVIADPPPFESNDASQSLSRHAGPAPSPNPATGQSPKPSPSRSASAKPPTRGPQPTGSPLPTLRSPAPTTTSAEPSSVYRKADTVGGTATFEFGYDGEVILLDAEPNPGWQVSAYRFYRDWVVVEFRTYGHRSTLHAYVEQGQPMLYVIEQETA